MTGRDLVSASLRLIGAIAPGESLDASDATDGLAAINRMIDSWSNEGLIIYATTAETPLTLTPNDSVYTMGTAGDFTTRPMTIEKAVIRDSTTDYALKFITLDEYTRLTTKSVQSTLPEYIYDDGGYPLRTLTLYPVPSAAKQLVLWTRRPLTNISTLDTEVSFPPGYEEALIYNAAMRLSPEYGRPTPQEVAMIANESKALIKRSNNRKDLLRVDSAIIANRRFNMITGNNDK